MEALINTINSQKERGMLFLGILIVLGLLIFGGVFYFLSKGAGDTSQVSDPTTQLPKEAEVQVTTSGFVPSEVKIAAGSAVRWVNKANQTVTVNSDDHPTHRKFKELNLGEFAKDSTVVHIFTNPGTYTYHDHLHPTRKGTVIVQ